MVEQVRLVEEYYSMPAPPLTPVLLNHRIFAFGTNPAAVAGDYPVAGQGNEVTSARAVNQSMRIIIDELLVGNYLEEIACNAVVDDDIFEPVPVGATPDDIARCSTATDVLPATCPGSNPLSVCICHLDAGCVIAPTATTPAVTIHKGDSVGILDVNQDGSVDDTRMIAGAVGIRCGSIDVPIDLDASYWNPSGDQQPPAMGGFDAMGPAIVLVPAGALPTNLECNLSFSPDIVDKEDNQICAPPNGDFNQSCTPGDVSAFKFKVEPLTVNVTNDEGEDILQNQTGVNRTSAFNAITDAPIDTTTVSGITVVETDTGTPFVGYTITTPPSTIRIAWTGTGLAANTKYTLTFPTSLKDTFGQPLPQTLALTFTTGN